MTHETAFLTVCTISHFRLDEGDGPRKKLVDGLPGLRKSHSIPASEVRSTSDGHVNVQKTPIDKTEKGVIGEGES